MDERSLREIIREELKKLSGMSWGARLGYIWDYYKPLMAAVIAVLAVISIGVSIYRNMQINHLLNVYLVNCNTLEADSESITADFTAYLGGIGEKDEILVDTSVWLDLEDTSQMSMASQMKFTTMTSAGEADVVVLDTEQYERYAEVGSFLDLREVLTEEQLEEWRDILVYGTDSETGKEIVSALKVTEAPLVEKYNVYAGEEAYACIMVNSSHIEMSAEFLGFMMKD